MSLEADDPVLTPVDRLYAEVKQLITDYCEKHGCKPSALGRVALNDTVFVQRVLAGGSVTTAKLKKLEEFIIADRSPTEARAAEFIEEGA
jgi:hypothetical protein